MQVRLIAGALAAAAMMAGTAAPALAESQQGAVWNNVRFNFGSNTWKMDSKFLPAVVDYATDEKPGTIIIDTRRKYLYFVKEGGKAMRFGIGVGRQGFGHRLQGGTPVRIAELPQLHGGTPHRGGPLQQLGGGIGHRGRRALTAGASGLGGSGGGGGAGGRGHGG